VPLFDDASPYFHINNLENSNNFETLEDYLKVINLINLIKETASNLESGRSYFENFSWQFAAQSPAVFLNNPPFPEDEFPGSDFLISAGYSSITIGGALIYIIKQGENYFYVWNSN
jgi:hypothetical protein